MRPRGRLFLLSHDGVRVTLPLQGTRAHVLGHNLLGDLGPALLEVLDVLLQLGDTNLLQLASHHLAFLIGSADAFQLLIILQEESQVLERHIHLGVAAQLAVHLGGFLATREGKLVDLVLDLVRCVAHEDGGAIDTSGHL